MNKHVTASQLKMRHEYNHSDSHFFDRSTMKFFGDTMSNYYVPRKTVLIDTYSESNIECYELQRRRPVKHGLCKSAFFAVDDYRRVITKGE